MKKEIDIRKVCSNCEDYNSEQRICTIRYVINGKDRKPLLRKPSQKGCTAFMFNIKNF